MKLISILLLLGATAVYAALPLTWGNILISNGYSREILEYTRTGQFVQKFSVPMAPGQTASDYNRDMVVDSRGNVHVFNGTFKAVISSLDVSTGQWSHLEIPGLRVNNGVHYGKLAIFGDYLFVTDHSGTSGNYSNVVRVNLLDGSWIRFWPVQLSIDVSIDLTIGRDGLLYTLNGASSPSGRFIEAFDPITLSRVRRIDLPNSFVYGPGMMSSQLHVDEGLNLYINQLYGPVYKLSPSLDVVGAFYYTRTSYVNDMNVAQDGEVLIVQSDGRVVILNPDFSELRTFDTTSYYSSSSLGAFIEPPVPEPSSLLGVTAAGLVLLLRHRRSFSR